MPITMLTSFRVVRAKKKAERLIAGFKKVADGLLEVVTDLKDAKQEVKGNIRVLDTEIGEHKSTIVMLDSEIAKSQKIADNVRQLLSGV